MEKLQMFRRLLIAVILCTGTMFAQVNLSRQGNFTVTTVAGLPVSDDTGTMYLVQDSADGTCATGGGSTKVTCVWDGAWSAYGGGAGGGTDDQTAAEVPFTPAGDVAATDTQAAIEELDTEKQPLIAGNSLGPADIDETANYVFSGTLFPTGATPTTGAVGMLAMDTDAWAASRGALQFYDGTAPVWVCGVLASDTPTDGQVVKWNTGGTCTWEDDTTGGGGGALNDLTDVDTTGQTSGDALIYDGVDWNPGDVATPTNTIEFTNKTIDGGAPRTGTTTIPTGANEIPMTRHEDDCTALTGVADGVMCFEEDANTLYVCESPEGIAGVCDAAGEWTLASGGGLTSPVAIADGGTGQTTQTAAMDALSPTTTKGDLLVDNGTNVIRVPVGTNTQVLTADSAQASGVAWAAAGGGDTILGTTINNATSSACDGGTGIDSVGVITIPAGTLSTGDMVEWVAHVTVGGPLAGTMPRVYYYVNSTSIYNSGDLTTGASLHNVLYVTSSTTVENWNEQFDNANTDASGQDNITVADLSANALTLGVSERYCATGDSFAVRISKAVLKDQ